MHADTCFGMSVLSTNVSTWPRVSHRRAIARRRTLKEASDQSEAVNQVIADLVSALQLLPKDARLLEELEKAQVSCVFMSLLAASSNFFICADCLCMCVICTYSYHTILDGPRRFWCKPFVLVQVAVEQPKRNSKRRVSLDLSWPCRDVCTMISLICNRFLPHFVSLHTVDACCCR